ncbi:MAG: ABC transporter permease, partial [Gemmatimonadetes bacterium]|nr:ABC transporter permease [Gemmatimonadota bacterium]
MNGRLNTLEEGIRIALSAILTNKIRTGLTILGVAIGVAVVVTMAALITGIRSGVMEGFEAAGPDNFIVTRFDMTEVRIVSDGSGRPPWWNRPKITPREADRIAALPAVREAIVDFDFDVSMSYEGDRVTGVMSSGDSPGWVAYTIGTFSAGRNFTQAEVRQSRAVAVISAPLAEALFGQLDPIGKRVRVATGRRGVNELFIVIGIFDLGDQPFAEAINHFAIFPYSAALKRLKANDMFLSVLVVPDTMHTPLEARDQVVGLMRSIRGLGPGEENNFAVIQSSQLIELFDQLTSVFFMVMIALSSVG